MIVGIVGSRRRNSSADFGRLVARLTQLERETGRDIKKIVTGDCKKGGDSFARDIADMFGWECDVKDKLDPETGEKLERYINDYFKFSNICYDRNIEIVRQPLDYLIALVACDRTGGTENTIKHFRKLRPDWIEKLIIL